MDAAWLLISATVLQGGQEPAVLSLIAQELTSAPVKGYVYQVTHAVATQDSKGRTAVML